MKLIHLLFILPSLLIGAYSPPATVYDFNIGVDSYKRLSPETYRLALDQNLFQGAVYSDGLTAHRSQIQVAGTRGSVSGYPNLSWVGWVNVPTSNSVGFPNGPAIAELKDSYTNPAINYYRALYMTFLSGGLYIGQTGAASSDFRRFVNISFISTYSGQRIWLDVRFTKGSADPLVYVNGVNISSSFVQYLQNTPPNWLEDAMIPTYAAAGYYWPAGVAPLGSWINGHLTDAESNEWRRTGRAPIWVAQGGNAVSYYTSLNAASKATETNAITSLNAAGSVSGSWASVAGARTGGTGTYYARYTSDNSAANAAKASLSLPAGVNRIGQKVAVRFWARASQAVTLPVAIAENNSGATEFQYLTLSTDWQELFLVFSTPITRTTINTLRFNDFTFPAGATIDVDDLEFIQVGALSLPSVQPILVLDDATEIAGNQAQLLGMYPVTERSDFRLVRRTVNTQRLSVVGPIFPFTGRAVITSWTINNAGSNTTQVSLGNVSGGSQYVSGLSIGAGATLEVPLLTNATQTELWSSSTTSEAINHAILGQIIGQN